MEFDTKRLGYREQHLVFKIIPGSIGAIRSSRQEYDSLTTKFTTQGDYKSFLQFMLDLEQSLRIVDLVSLRLAPASTASKGGEPVYSFDVTVRTYWLK